MRLPGRRLRRRTTSTWSERLETWELDSRFVNPRRVVFNDPPPGVAPRARRLRVNVLAPRTLGPSSTHPVLYLLHGRSDAYDHWAHPESGGVVEATEDLDAFVVMPEAARGWYANWWNGGRRGDPAWEHHHLDELVPLVEERLPLRAGRRWRAIAGLSMGGLGAMSYAARRPDVFGTAASFSGALSIRRPRWPDLFDTPTEDHRTVYGDPSAQAFYWAGHDPSSLIENLGATRLFVTAGDGTPRADDRAPDTSLAAIERELRSQSEEFVAAAGKAGIDVEWAARPGSHEWPTWRRSLADGLGFGFFDGPPHEPAEWTYETVAQSGVMWGLRFRFDGPPEAVQRFERRGSWLRASGSGAVTVTAAGGDAWRETLPFQRALAP